MVKCGVTQIFFEVDLTFLSYSFPDTVALLAVSGLCELFSTFSPILMASELKFEKTILNSFLQAILQICDQLTFSLDV